MTRIINKSMSSGIVPQCFKHALVKPVLKRRGGGCLGPDCLKKTAALFQFAILAKGTGACCPETVFAAVRISQPSRALAILPTYSTETTLLLVVNDLRRASDTGCVSILSLLDLSITFDTTDHGIRITRLHAAIGCFTCHYWLFRQGLCLFVMNQPHVF